MIQKGDDSMKRIECDGCHTQIKAEQVPLNWWVWRAGDAREGSTASKALCICPTCKIIVSTFAQHPAEVLAEGLYRLVQSSIEAT